MLTRRQLIATIAGGGTAIIAGYSITTDTNREATGSEVMTNEDPEDPATYRITTKKLPKTDAFGVAEVDPLRENELLVIVEVDDAEKIDTMIVRHGKAQIHTESIDETGDYRISFSREYNPPTFTVEAKGDGSTVGTYKFSCSGL